MEVLKKVESGLRLNVLDADGSGTVSVDEIHDALRDLLGLSVHDENKTLAEYVHAHADATGNGIVTREDFEHFCTVLPGGFGKYYNTNTTPNEQQSQEGPMGDDHGNDDDDEGFMF